MKRLVVVVMMAMFLVIGCQTDNMYPRTVGNPGAQEYCVEKNRMDKMVENETWKKIATLNGDTLHVKSTWQGKDLEWTKRVKITFVYLDKNCVVNDAFEHVLAKKDDNIPIEIDLPYKPDDYFYYVWQTTF